MAKTRKWKQAELKLEPEKQEKPKSVNYRQQFFEAVYKERK